MFYSLLFCAFIIIMFLNIRKIGKAKHKFKAKVSFIRITNQSTEKGLSFKVKIERGSHEIEAVSQPSRKGTAKFANSQYVIPMTLYCDEDEKQIKYLQKQATIKAFQCDQNGKQIRKIGQKTMDLSQYASRGMLKLEIQLDPAKKVDSPIIILQIFLQRQDDDSKSVDTYSSNNDKKNQGDMDPKSNKVQKKTDKRQQRQQLSEQLPNKKEKPQKQKRYNTEDNDLDNVKQKDNYLKPPANKARNDRKLSEDKSDDFKKRRDVDREQQFEDIRKQMERQQKLSRDPFKIANNMIPQTIIGSLGVQQRQPAQNIKSEAETQFTKGESPQLQIFLLKKAVKDKQSQLSNMKRQNENLKKTIDKLVQQSSSAKQAEKRTGFERQVQDLKKALTSKDIEIDKLTTANKALSARQQQYEKTIVKLRQEAIMNKEKISDMKYRQAYLMQQLFQTANKEALEQASRFLSI